MKIILPLLVLLLSHFAITAQSDCRSTEYRQEQIRRSPELVASIQEIESFTRSQLHAARVAVTGSGYGVTTASPGMPDIITIPVVVHIVYNTAGQNISNAQVQSQIDILNRDYRKLNADTAGIPGYYRMLAADCGFQFALAGIDTNGNTTNGIIRKHTNVQAFGINDDIKFTARGGDDAWDRDRYLNIWVGNLSGGTLGYSSYVGCPKETDGVTVTYTAFGTVGTATAPFNLGRTATHEIGHWLNMIHIWGDAYCGNDEVDDTPPQQMATYGNPSGMIVSCGNGPYGNMYMNYMDFTNDIGMHMFTYGQRDRMRTLFAAGGFRYAIRSSNVVTETTPPSNTRLPAAPDSGNTIRIYPNPAVSMVSVTLTDESLTGSMLEIYNQMGQRLVVTRVTGLTFQVSVAALPAGIYFVRISGSKQGSSVKMVKI